MLILFSDASPPTEVPFVNRSKTIHAVDRNGADGAQEITEALIGRGVYLLVSYFPGDVWNCKLTIKAPPIICSRRQFQILPLFQK